MIRMQVLFLSLMFLTGCDSTNPSNSEHPAEDKSRQDTAQLTPTTPKPPKPSGSLPHFIDVTVESGLRFERYDDMRGQHRLIEANGGGVGMIDYDNDGWWDVLLTNGCKVPDDDGSHPSEMIRNLGGNRFVSVSSASRFHCTGYGQGAAVGDFDNDGFDDLYVAAYGRNSLWQNNGDGTFTDITDQANAGDDRWSSSAAFADLNGDGYLDLYVVNYVDPGNPPRLCPEKGSPDGFRQCPPTMFRATEDKLLLNDGQGRLEDVTERAGIADADGKGLSAVIFDYDRDGRLDIFVANDGTPNFLYVNEGRASELDFKDKSSELGVALNREGKAEACMGIACGDANGDLWPDLFVTNFFAETNTLYSNLNGKGFQDTTNRSGLGPPSRPLLGFGTDFLDFDNDGSLDLVVANGHIDDFTWANPNEAYRMPPLFFRNEGGGIFTDVSHWSGTYFEEKWLGRGLAIGDLDNDGDQDFIVSHQRAPSAVLSNETAAQGKFVSLRCIGRKCCRSAIGARVEAVWSERKLGREVLGGGSFQSSADRRLHFGLGKEATIPELTIVWPSGDVDRWENVAAGSYMAIEGRGLYTTPRN